MLHRLTETTNLQKVSVKYIENQCIKMIGVWKLRYEIQIQDAAQYIQCLEGMEVKRIYIVIKTDYKTSSQNQRWLFIVKDSDCFSFYNTTDSKD